jgi:RNA polymerase sigma factor (sigma-70 family)
MSGAARRTSIQLAPREVSVANQTIADLADRQEHVADQARFEHGTPLAGAFDRLTLKQRQLLVERFVEDLLPSEIARRHGVSTSAVSQRLKTVLKTLRELLTKDSEEGVKT